MLIRGSDVIGNVAVLLGAAGVFRTGTGWPDIIVAAIMAGGVLGAHLVGPHADEVINLFGLAIRHGLTAEDLKARVFASPTGVSDIACILQVRIGHTAPVN